METKNILVTGGAGFIGSNLAIELSKSGHNVIIIDDFSNAHFKNLFDFQGEILCYDLEEFDFSILNKYKLDIIFHQAAITDTTIPNENLMLRKNTNVFKKILNYCLDNGIDLIYASSAATYGNAPSPQKEEYAGKPNNIYGFSKYACDMIAEKYKDVPIKIIGLRYFNVFGPREQHKGKMASMVWKIIKDISQDKRPKLFKYGEQKRDQVYVKDVVRANILAYLKSKENGIINVGSGKAISFNYIVEKVNETLNKNIKPEYIENPYKEFYQEHTEADLTKAKKLIGYSPKWSFEEALKDYVLWLKKNNYI